MSVLDLQRPLARLTLLNGTLPPALAWCPYHSSQAHTVYCIDLSPCVKTFTFQWPLFKSVHMQIPKIQYHSSNLHLSVSVLHNSVREKKTLHISRSNMSGCMPSSYICGRAMPILRLLTNIIQLLSFLLSKLHPDWSQLSCHKWLQYELRPLIVAAR